MILSEDKLYQLRHKSRGQRGLSLEGLLYPGHLGGAPRGSPSRLLTHPLKLEGLNQHSEIRRLDSRRSTQTESVTPLWRWTVGFRSTYASGSVALLVRLPRHHRWFTLEFRRSSKKHLCHTGDRTPAHNLSEDKLYQLRHKSRGQRGLSLEGLVTSAVHPGAHPRVSSQFSLLQVQSRE